jgi:RNA polymerase sigma-70 factor (ECF subfamily)
MATTFPTTHQQGQSPINSDGAISAATFTREALEASLIDRVVEGDHEAFADLLKPYERMIYVIALSVLGNEADAEEAAQESILKAFRGLPRFRKESKFSTWLVQIVLNESKMKLRKDRRRLYDSLDEGTQNDDGDYIPSDFADWREIPSEALENQELRQALATALATLPAKYRSVLVLRHVQQLNIRETADLLGLSEANVKTRLSRARLQMRDALAPGIMDNWRTTENGESTI